MGRFRRTFPLAHAVDPDRTKTEYANGVYEIRVQKQDPEEDDIGGRPPHGFGGNASKEPPR